MTDQPAACLMFGIFELNQTGVVDRRECSVCKGDHCPYEVGEAPQGACPHCFGTGMAPVSFDLENRNESVCPHCKGTGKLL